MGKSTINRITKLAENSNYTLNQCSYSARIYPLSEHFTFNAVKCDQVQHLANGKAPGTNKISIHVIKDCLPAILASLTSIIIAYFEFDTSYLTWKTAEVTLYPRLETTTFQTIIDRFHYSLSFLKFVSLSTILIIKYF